jgi:transposase
MEAAMETLPVLGIDVAKAKLVVCLLRDGNAHQHTFDNTAAGFAQLDRWLHKLKATLVHACLEATGTYGEELTLFLHEANHVVSVVNPARIKGFAQSELARNKTDKADAALIARFCLEKQPEAWHPPAPQIRELRALVRRLDDLQQMLVQEQNRLSSGVSSEAIRSSLEQMIQTLHEQIQQLQQQIREHLDQYPDLRRQRDLIDSIPGLGALTAARLIAEFQDLRAYPSARQLAAQAGLTPRHYQSGSSVHGRPRLCKLGNARIRKALYMPAVVAMRFNPVIRQFAARLRQRGKHNMLIIGAVMRKLLHLVFGVLKSGKAFDPEYAPGPA